MSRLLLLSLFFLLSVNAFAGSVEQYIDEAEKYKGDTIKNINEAQLKEVLDDYGKAPLEASYSEKELRARAETMMRESKSKANDTSLPPRKRAEAQAAAGVLESYDRVNKFHSLDSEATFKKSFLISENPLDVVKSECGLSGELDEKIDLEPEPYEVEVDDVRETEVERTCEEDDSAFHKCEATLRIKCKKIDECDSGGVVLSSVDSNIGWSYSYPRLLIGTLSIIPDPHMCQIATKVIRFVVKNKEQIDQFMIDRINYSDHIRITLNGVQVLNTVPGGNGEYFVINTVFGIESSGPLKRGAEFAKIKSGSGSAPRCNTKQYYNINPRADLRPYLKDGVNELKVELAFGNNGQLHIHLITKQHCCNAWDETWEEANCDQNS